MLPIRNVKLGYYCSPALLRNVILVKIHDFHNGGPLGWSGNKSHHSEASKATVTKTNQSDATRSNLIWHEICRVNRY